LNENQFRTAVGVIAPDLSGIEEGFDECVEDNGYTLMHVNVSAEHIAAHFLHLMKEMDEPGFFIVEVPATQAEEKERRKKAASPFHKRVYYLDGISKERAARFFEEYHELFVNDGLCNFGFGSLTHEELFVGAFKIFEIFTPNPEHFRAALWVLGLEQRVHLRTIWDNTTAEAPARREALIVKPSIWHLTAELEHQGFYLADVRED
jgi:hypothetical protein